MNVSYQKLNTLPTNIIPRSINMSGRTPSFIVVGLVIIMFLLGLFYMSCSSKNTELRLSLEQFEERIRSLTIKNSDSEKKYENLNSRKRELDEEYLTIQRQMEKKDSEINDLNTKLNEKLAELQSLQSDKKVVDEELNEYKTLRETLAGKNTLIEQLQKQLNDQKQSNDEELTRIKKEFETYKNNQSAQLSSKNTFIIPPQRYRPWEPNNHTITRSTSLFPDPLNKLNNLTKEVKGDFVPAALDLKGQVLNAFGLNSNSSTSTILGQQQQENINNEKNQQQVGQNVPPPPLANHAQQQQQADHIESAQAAPQHVDNNQAVVDNSRYQNNPIADNRNDKLSELDEEDDEEELNIDNAQQNVNPVKQNNLENINQRLDDPSLVRSNKKTYRTSNRKQYRKSKNYIRQKQQLDNEEELEENDNNEQYRQVRKRNVV